MDDRTAWLDNWCKVRSLSQQELARRWATRNDPEPEPLPPAPKPLSSIAEMKAYVASTKLRPMRQEEAYTDYEKKYWRMLRIPDEQSRCEAEWSGAYYSVKPTKLVPQP